MLQVQKALDEASGEEECGTWVTGGSQSHRGFDGTLKWGRWSWAVDDFHRFFKMWFHMVSQFFSMESRGLASFFNGVSVLGLTVVTVLSRKCRDR